MPFLCKTDGGKCFARFSLPQRKYCSVDYKVNRQAELHVFPFCAWNLLICSFPGKPESVFYRVHTCELNDYYLRIEWRGRTDVINVENMNNRNYRGCATSSGVLFDSIRIWSTSGGCQKQQHRQSMCTSDVAIWFTIYIQNMFVIIAYAFKPV